MVTPQASSAEARGAAAPPSTTRRTSPLRHIRRTGMYKPAPTATRPAGSGGPRRRLLGLAAAVGARLRAVAAELHRAPGGGAVRRVVVERPVAVATGLEPRPAAVEHRAERAGDDLVELVAVSPRSGRGRGHRPASESRAAARFTSSTAAAVGGSPLFAIARSRRASRNARARSSSPPRSRSSSQPGSQSTSFSRSTVFRNCCTRRAARVRPSGCRSAGSSLPDSLDTGRVRRTGVAVRSDQLPAPARARAPRRRRRAARPRRDRRRGGCGRARGRARRPARDAGPLPGARDGAARSGQTRGAGRLERRGQPVLAARRDGLAEVRAVTGRQPAAAMLFREASIQGRLVNLRAANDLGRYVRLVSGRLPAVCVPSHCEVLRLKGKGPIPSTKALHLIEVGRAVLKPDAPIAPFVLPTPPTEQVARAVRYHTPQPSPVVIANGVAGLSGTTELQTFYRSYAWLLPLGRGDLHPWDVDAFTNKVRRLTAEIESRSDEFQVVAPTEPLAAAVGLLARGFAPPAAPRRRGRGAAPRLHDPRGGRAAPRRHRRPSAPDLVRRAPLAGRAAHARRVVRARRRGHRRGLGRSAAVSLRSSPSRAGSPAGAVIGHALLSTSGLAGGRRRRRVRRPPALRHGARAPAVQLGRLAFTPLDAAACGAVAVVLVGWARGSVDAQQLACRHRDERVPAARAGADRVRRRCCLGAPARADAARARPGRPPRTDLAPARRGITGAQSGPRCDRGDLPRSEPRPRAVRGRLPLDAPAWPARRGGVRRAGRRTSSARISRSSCRCCTARRSDRCPARRHRWCASPATSHRARRSVPRAARTLAARPCRAGGRTSPMSRLASLGRRLTPRNAGLRLLALPAGRRFTLPVTGNR